MATQGMKVLVKEPFVNDREVEGEEGYGRVNLGQDCVTSFINSSSLGLGFFNPTFQLRRWDVTSFCMQLKKQRG